MAVREVLVRYALVAAITCQTVLVVYVAVQVVKLERTVTGLSATVTARTAKSGANPATPQPNHGVDESRLRAVIREEFAGLTAVPGAQTSSAPAPHRSTGDEIEAVERRLAGFVNAGYIDQRELDRVQVEIARLDTVTRRAMFTRLTQAINSGQVKIRIN